MLMRLIRTDVVFFLMIRRPPRSTLDRSSAASDVYKRQSPGCQRLERDDGRQPFSEGAVLPAWSGAGGLRSLSLIHISEPTRPY